MTVERYNPAHSKFIFTYILKSVLTIPIISINMSNNLIILIQRSRGFWPNDTSATIDESRKGANSSKIIFGR